MKFDIVDTVLLVEEILQSSVGDRLRLPKYRGDANPFRGHCYVASEALYHLLGGKEQGWKPMFLKHEGENHWFLQKNGLIIDITVSQFKKFPPYDNAIGKGFLTKKPSKRARTIISIVKEEENARRD